MWENQYTVKEIRIVFTYNRNWHEVDSWFFSLSSYMGVFILSEKKINASTLYMFSVNMLHFNKRFSKN